MLDTIRTFLTPAKRRALYAVAVAVFGVLVAFGVVDSVTADQWSVNLDRVLGLLASLIALGNVNDADPDAESGAEGDAESDADVHQGA